MTLTTTSVTMSDHVPTLIADGEIRGPVAAARYHRPEGECLLGALAVVLGHSTPARVETWVPYAVLPESYGHRHIPVPLWPYPTSSAEAIARALEAIDDELGPRTLETPTPLEDLTYGYAVGDGLPPADPIPPETRVVTPQHTLGRRMGMMGFDRADGLAFCEEALAYPSGALSSRNDLTAAEVAAVNIELDALETMRARRRAEASDVFDHPAAYRRFAAEWSAARKALGIQASAEAAP